MKRWKKEEIFWNFDEWLLRNVVVEYIRYEFLNLLNSDELTRFSSNILMNKLEWIIIIFLSISKVNDLKLI